MSLSSGLKHGLRRRCDRLSDSPAFFRLDDEGRRQQKVVAAKAIHTTLDRIGQHSMLRSRGKDAPGNVRLAGKRLPGRFVFYELHSRQQAEPADVAHMRVLLERFERRKEFASRRNNARK